MSTWTCKYASEIITTAEGAGFCAVEWDLNFIPMPLGLARRRALKTDFNSAGISTRFHLPYSTCDLGHPTRSIREASLRFLKLNVDLLADFGSDFAVLHFAADSADVSPPVEDLAQLVSHAKDSGVAIGIENLMTGFSSDLLTLYRIAADVRCKLALDVGHVLSKHTLDFAMQTIGVVGPSIAHVHFYGQEDSTRNHLPFRNDEDARRIATVIARDCVASWWTIEMDSIVWCEAQKQVIRSWITVQ